MECFPADIEHKLGFDIVRSRLVELADTELGRSAIEEIEPLTDREAVEQRLARVAEWRTSIESGENQGLAVVPNVSGILTRIAPVGSWVTPDEALEIESALRTARLVHSFFSSKQGDYPRCAERTSVLQPAEELERSIRDLFTESGGLKDDASPELRRIRRRIKTAEDKLRKAATSALNEAHSAKVAAGDEPTIRGGRTVIPIKAEAKRKLDGLVVDSSATGQTVFIEPQACIELNNELRLLDGRERRETIRILEALTDRIRERRSQLESNQEVLTEFDILRSAARLAIELDCVQPVISEEVVIDIRSGINPALALVRLRSRGAESDLEVVPLTAEIGRDSRVLVISGPNAGGKSVALKTIGLFAMMAAHGLQVPAEEETSVPMFDGIFVDIGDEQSIETDLSTFSSHLQRLRRIVEESTSRSLVLIDELGTATDPTAGAAIGQAVIEHLVSAGSLAVVTTHFGALKAFANETAGVHNGAMMFDRKTLSPTYVFEPGLPGSSFAFEIAERASFPSSVLDRAREVAGPEESHLEDLISELERAKMRAQGNEARLARALSEAEQARKEADEARRRIESEVDEILKSAETEAELLLKKANSTIERTIREIREAQAERERTQQARQRMEKLRESVEDRVRAREGRLKNRQPPSSADAPPAALVQGDRVILDDGDVVGEVQQIDGEEVTVTFGSMQTRVAKQRLKKVGKPEQQKVEVGRVKSPASDDDTLPEIHRRIDVRGYRVAEAIPDVEKFIDRAVRSGLNRVEILHGTGTGALRSALQGHLRDMPEVKAVSEAPVEQGGAGVSVVILH